MRARAEMQGGPPVRHFALSLIVQKNIPRYVMHLSAFRVALHFNIASNVGRIRGTFLFFFSYLASTISSLTHSVTSKNIYMYIIIYSCMRSVFVRVCVMFVYAHLHPPMGLVSSFRLEDGTWIIHVFFRIQPPKPFRALSSGDRHISNLWFPRPSLHLTVWCMCIICRHVWKLHSIVHISIYIHIFFVRPEPCHIK